MSRSSAHWTWFARRNHNFSWTRSAHWKIWSLAKQPPFPFDFMVVDFMRHAMQPCQNKAAVQRLKSAQKRRAKMKNAVFVLCTHLKHANHECVMNTAQICMSWNHRYRREFYYYFVFHLTERSFYFYGNLLYMMTYISELCLVLPQPEFFSGVNSPSIGFFRAVAKKRRGFEWFYGLQVDRFLAQFKPATPT